MRRYAKTPSIFQMEMTECGAASLCMVLAYHGCHVPLERMRVETGVSRDGCNMKGIKHAAQRYGMEVHAYRREPDQLRKMDVPSIIHWNFNHFVVFEGVRGGHAYINDPAIGRRKLTLKELDEGFTGVVMTFKKTKQFQKTRKKRTLLSFVSHRLKGQYGVLAQLLYIGLLMVIPGLILPVLSQVFIDDVLGNGYKDWLTRLLVFMGGCILLKEALRYYRSLVLEKLKTKMILVSCRDFLTHMFKLPISFFDQRYTGDLVSRMMNNAEVSKFLAGDLAETVLNFITACFYLIILVLYSPVMTLVGLMKVIICIVGVAVSARSLKDATIKLQMSAGRLNGAVSSGLGITDSIKASGMEMEYGNRILGHQAKFANCEQELMRRQQMLDMIPDAMGQIVDVLLLLVGGMLVIRGQMTMGMLVAYNALYDSFCEPVDKLVGFFGSLQQLRSNISRVEDIEKHEQSICFAQPQNMRAMTGKLQGNIELRDISFGYSVIQPPVVEHFHFKLYSGETIAFVGASGCGKSTISKIVSGLYRQWDGEVLFDGIAQHEIPRNVFCNSVATVSQDIHLFSGTIRDNLTMWDSTILEADLERAAKDACIYDFIMQQPGRYDYMLSEGAQNISGGERQRLEIARALAKKPSVLIMDEATSALDPLVEKKIMDNIRLRGCTCVIVAHRLSAIRDCSQIVVMEKGRIVERGTHLSLMREEGCYARLMREEENLSERIEMLKGEAGVC
ncbi:MAG: NHLP family bacteriocin export ABC transporter peptidase/permease/ATPase subunit [Clostridia bacterium]|nr:NHLP family bacteriocin export ABC transporter peptidase/permease/ATPase subunit [Clostridia bacterium]